jgi:beta-galactosidase
MSSSDSGFARRDFMRGAGAALIAGPCLWGFPALNAGAPSSNANAAVTYDERSLIFKGKRKLAIYGEMHYARSTRAMWPHLLDRSKELGLTGVASYVFWNYHEPARDVYNFTGERDLGYFLDLCKERELQVFLRSGPYCCAEWNFGGFPPYLRDIPGITLRTYNPPYLERVEKYYRRLAEVVNPRLATRGGPVVLIQVENEYNNVAARYGEGGKEYLQWMADLAKRIGFADVPTTMCEGASEGPIATLNGSEITAQRVAQFRQKDTRDPLLWTELYPAWYEVWGETDPIRRDRDPHTLALAILVFLANGGAGFNYYMWHGGTNFARNSMYLQTTSYDFHAPLDAYGRVTLKGEYLGHLHRALLAQQDYLMYGERTVATDADGAQRTTWSWKGREVALVLQYPPNAAADPKARPTSALIIGPDGKAVFDSEALNQQIQSSWTEKSWEPVAGALNWRAWREPMPEQRATEGIHAAEPTEQLLLTKDHTDYCWYSTKINVEAPGPQELVIPFGGDFFYAYVDGKPVAQTVAPLKEDRGPITPEDPAHPRIFMNGHKPNYEGYRHVFDLGSLEAGEHRVDLLCTAIGIIKGDWMIDSPMNFERKGIWEGVELNGAAVTGWEMIPYLAGEKAGVVEKGAAWAELGEPATVTWYKTTFRLTPEQLAHDADYRINAEGLGKGMMFVNGHGVGRHWLIVSPGTGGQPTQQAYLVPRDWLRAENTLVVFEEQAVGPVRVRMERRSA